MNPYDFVRIAWDQPGTRRAAPRGDRFDGVSGRVTGTITTLTPFFLPDKKTDNPQRFLQNRQHQAVIPGSSLKGLFRSVVETVSGSAFWFASNRDLPPDSLPKAFRPPPNSQHLDAAYRLFGYLNRGDVLAGRVSFDDATCDDPHAGDAIFTCILSAPKPRHHAWYLDRHGRVTGRKFYFHHAGPLYTASTWQPREAINNPQKRQNAYIKPLEAGNSFTFQMSFTGVAPDDLNVLLYALVLEPAMRHKLGYAKPAGLGSVHVQLTALEFVDHLARYRAGGGGITRYDGQALHTEIAYRTEAYTTNRASITLNDLRRIWHWPPDESITYRYPSQEWFQHHPRTPIDETP